MEDFFGLCMVLRTALGSNKAVLPGDIPPSWCMRARSLLVCCGRQVRATIKAGSRTKRAVAGVLLNASLTHVRARRVADGLDLQYARRAPPAAAVMWAVLVAAASFPLHRCGLENRLFPGFI